MKANPYYNATIINKMRKAELEGLLVELIDLFEGLSDDTPVRKEVRQSMLLKMRQAQRTKSRVREFRSIVKCFIEMMHMGIVEWAI